MAQIKLSALLAPSFYVLHKDIKEKQHTHYWLKGGRGSTKSSFVSEEIVLGIMEDPLANAVVLRKVGETMRESVFEQYQWAVDALGVTHLWLAQTKPMRLIYLPTGQRIIFKGADNPRKIKSQKWRRGYTRYLHYEEADEFGNIEDIRNINQSLIRGGETQVFYSYNPPLSNRSWINEEVAVQGLRPDTLVHHSNYLTVPRAWLGDVFLSDAEHLKETRPDKYAHEYLGEIIGTGAEVFSNITSRRITDDEVKRFDKVHRGLDFGFAADPLHYTANYYDKARKRLYIFQEIHKVGLTNDAAVKMIKEQNPLNQYITADSAEPRTINEFGLLGLRLTGAKKGPGSVEHGVKWLSDLNEIIIDPERCPNTHREFIHYELERDKNGNLKGSYPDKDNHSIDATRYSLEDEMNEKKWLI